MWLISDTMTDFEQMGEGTEMVEPHGEGRPLREQKFPCP
jgi:hypothetical protein